MVRRRLYTGHKLCARHIEPEGLFGQGSKETHRRVRWSPCYAHQVRATHHRKHGYHLMHIPDTITIFLTQIGIIRANCVAFPISVRNSASAVAYLLTKTNVTHVIVGSEVPYQQLASSALDIMREAGTPLPETSTMLTFEEIMREDEIFEPLPYVKFGWDDAALIMHSSGQFTWNMMHLHMVLLTFVVRFNRFPQADRLVALEICPTRRRSVWVSPISFVTEQSTEPSNIQISVHETSLVSASGFKQCQCTTVWVRCKSAGRYVSNAKTFKPQLIPKHT